jgi:hypothetical protein
MFQENYEEAKDSLSMLRKQLLKYGYASVDSFGMEKRELDTEKSQEKHVSISKFPR